MKYIPAFGGGALALRNIGLPNRTHQIARTNLSSLQNTVQRIARPFGSAAEASGRYIAN